MLALTDALLSARLNFLCLNNAFVSLQVPEYLHHVNKRLEEEADRVITYLDQSTQYVHKEYD